MKTAGVDSLHLKPTLPPVQYKHNALKLHYPVMIDNVKQILKEFLIDPKAETSLLDCTLGLGGHSLSLLSAFERLHMFFLIFPLISLIYRGIFVVWE